MTDRELLELAAKAAGIDIYFDEDGDCYRVKASGNRHYWNPLSYDGDALRLAVKLNVLASPEFFHYRSLERFGNQGSDDLTATRRAIVRAAAEIGKAMP